MSRTGRRNPKGPESGNRRVLRGAWVNRGCDSIYFQASRRFWVDPLTRDSTRGFYWAKGLE